MTETPTAATTAPALTVVVPTFNEAANVRPLVAKLTAALAGIAYEVMFVDDNSPDGTYEEVRTLSREDARIRCIRRIGRRGLSSVVPRRVPGTSWALAWAGSCHA
jgi:dolichol-phosphate mannosyltransferase